jgi:toxin CptA
VDRLFDPVGTRRLPDVNWAGYVAFFVGIFATWLFMYGLIPFFQGPVAISMGGVDLSWLAGGLTSAAVYAVLGPIVAARYDDARFSSTVRRGAPATAPRPAAAEAAGAPEVIA